MNKLGNHKPHPFCGKKKYITENDVIFVGREQMFEFCSQQLFYYFCDDCLAWHLTSKQTKNRVC